MADLTSIYGESIYNDLMYRDVQAPTAQYRMKVLEAERDRQFRDQDIAYKRGQADLYSPVTAAGLGNSGVAERAATEYMTDYTNRHDDVMAQFEEAKQQTLLELANIRRANAIIQFRAQQQALAAMNQNVLGGI